MDKRYRTVRMGTAPNPGDIFSSWLLNPAPAPDKWWKVMFSPAPLAGQSGGFAVTLQECDPKPTKGPAGDKVHALLRATPTILPLAAPPPPEPSLAMIYAEVRGMRDHLHALERCVANLAAQQFDSAAVRLTERGAL